MERTSSWYRRSLVGAGMLLLISSSSVLCQTTANPFTFGVFGGASIPVGHLADDDGVNVGFNLGGMIAVQQPTWPVMFRLDGQWNRFNPKDDSEDFHFDITTVNLDVVFMPAPTTSLLRPYFLLGPTYAHSSVGAQGASLSTNDYGFNGGVGVTYALSGFSTFAEARYFWIHTDENSNSIIPISVGIKIP